MANVELATAYVSLVPTMQGVQGKVAEALAPAEAEADKAGKSSGGMFAGGFAGALSAAAVGVAAGAAAVGGAAVGLYKVGAVFDDVTDTIRIGTGASGEALDQLVDVAKQVGTQVPTSFEAAGSVVADLNTRLGLSGDTLNTIAQQYIQAGNILGSDVDINTTTAAFSAFGIEGANVEGAMDSLFQVAQATGVGMNELATTVQTNAVPMQNLGFSFEETAALAGSLDKAGLNTSQTMASMGKSLVTLAKAGEEPQAAFKRTTGEIGEFIKSGDTASALNLASKVFGTKGATAFVGALQSGKINLDDLTASAGMTSDTILGLGKEIADAAESWTMIKSKALLALEPVGTAVFNLAGQGLGFLNDNMDKVTDTVFMLGKGLTDAFGVIASGDFKGPIFGQEEDSKFVDVLFKVRDGFLATQETARAFFEGLTKGTAFVGPSVAGAFGAIGNIINSLFSSIGPTLGGLLPILGQVWAAFSPLQLIFSALMPVLPQIAELIGTLATSLGGALTGALTALMPTFLELSNMLLATLAGMFVAVMPAVIQMAGMLAGLFTQLAPVVAEIVGVLGQLVIQLVAALMPIIMQLVSTVMPMVVTIFGAVVSAIVPLVTMLAGLLIPIIQALMPVVVTVFGVIADVIGSVMQIIMGVIQVVTGIISGNWSQVWEGIGNIFGGIWSAIVSLVTGALAIIGSVVIAGLTMLFGFIGGILGNIGKFFADTWNNITNGISNFIGGVGRFFSGLPGAITGALSGAGTWLFDAGKNIVQGLFNGIKSLASTIGNFFLGLLPGWIVEPFKIALGIHSPSRVFRGLGVNIGQGLLLGVGDMENKIDSKMGGLVTVPSPAYGSASASGDYRTSGGFGATYNIYETDDPIATANAVSRRQSALAS